MSSYLWPLVLLAIASGLGTIHLTTSVDDTPTAVWLAIWMAGVSIISVFDIRRHVDQLHKADMERQQAEADRRVLIDERMQQLIGNIPPLDDYNVPNEGTNHVEARTGGE